MGAAPNPRHTNDQLSTIFADFLAGNPHLEKHVVSAITRMKVSAPYKGFKKLLDKALPIPQAQFTSGLNEMSDDEEEAAN
jgi:hypothetical protein